MPQSGKSSKFKFRMLTFNAEPQRFFYYSFSLYASAFRNKELAKVKLNDK